MVLILMDICLYGMEKINNSFLILEPMAGIPPMYLPIAVGEEDVDTTLIEEKSFGEIIVQSRKLK